MNRKHSSLKSSKVSGKWLSKVSAIMVIVGMGVRIVYNYINVLGKMISRPREYGQEQKKSDNGDNIVSSPLPSSCEKSADVVTEVEAYSVDDVVASEAEHTMLPVDVEQTFDDVNAVSSEIDPEYNQSDAEDLIRVIIELDSNSQLKGVLNRVFDEGVRTIDIDLTVEGLFAHFKFNCNKSQISGLAIKLAEISPPLRLGNLDDTPDISEFRTQLEMAQALQQLKPTLPN